MDEMYCSKCGDLLIYKCEHLSTTSNKYIVEPCKNCTNCFIHVKDRLPKEYEIVIVRFDIEPFFGTGYVSSDGNWCTDDSRLDNHVINWADIPPIGRKYD
jgi:hypothetical protein